MAHFQVIYTALIESMADYIYSLAKRDVSFKQVAQFIWCISKSPVKLQQFLCHVDVLYTIKWKHELNLPKFCIILFSL